MYEYDNEDDEVLDLTVDDLFNDESDNLDEGTGESNSNSTTELNMTQAVSKRINEVRKETELSTRDAMAKELGFDDYADLQKSREKQMLTEVGVDTEEMESVVERIVQQRINEDPRFKKLAEIERQEKDSFVKSQLTEISNISGINYTSLDQLSKDVLDLWEKTGNLKQAYMAYEGENLLSKNRSKSERGSFNHLASPGSSTVGKTRGLTKEERDIYRLVFDGNISDEELNKKTIED